MKRAPAASIARREKALADAEGGEQAEAAIVLIDHRQAAEALALDEVDGVVGGAVAADGDDVALHDIADARGEIGDEDRGLDAEFVEDVIDPLIGIAGAGGDGARVAGQLLEAGHSRWPSRWNPCRDCDGR